MTFHTRMAPKPTRRRVRRSDTRRAIYVTLAFTLAIASAISLMGGVFLASYYTDHGAPIAAVNGEKISKDAVKDRANLNVARYERELADYQTLRNQGKITTTEYSAFENTINTSENQSTIFSDALTQLVDEAEVNQYAAQNNIVITDQQVDAQIQTDSTLPDMRDVNIISVPPQATPPAVAPTASDISDALTHAQAYIKEIQGGKTWADVSTEVNAAYPGSSNASSTNGALGLVGKDGLAVDPDFADAIFALKKSGDITAPFRGSDGTFRFATVTNIVAQYVDNAFQSTIASTSNADLYRAFARANATKKAVQSAIEAKYVSGPTLQRRVHEIAIAAGYGAAGGGDEVKLRILVFAPAHSETNATNVPSTDPAWTDAKNRADAAVATLRADPSKFATMAADTTVNDDQFFSTTSGAVPWIPADLFNAQTSGGSTGLGMPAVAAAVFADGVAVNTILDPIPEAAAGYVVVQFQGRRPAPDQRIANAQFMINSGTDFATEAMAISEASDASSGGDMGWVSPYMLTTTQQQVIFATPVGRISPVVSGNGFFIFQVVDEQTRVADPDQQAKLKKVVFPSWLSELQANGLVWKDAAALSAMAPATPS